METDLNKLKNLIDSLEKDLRKARELVKELEGEVEKKPYKDIPGLEGSFDGFVMITDSGEKHDVPANYAAKTKLMYGDRLKMIDEDGKKVFKNISKQPRKLLDGVLNRKEGKWYALTDKGTYRVSDTCVEFNKFNVNDRVTVAVPDTNFNAPFAAIETEPAKDDMNMDFAKPAVHHQPIQAKPQPVVHVQIKNPNPRPAPVPARRPAKPRTQNNSENREFVSDLRPQSPQAPAPRPAPQSAPVTQILDDDDLR